MTSPSTPPPAGGAVEAGEAKTRRWRVIKPKPRQITAQWGKADRFSEPDLCYAWGSRAQKPDSRVLMRAIEEAEVHKGRSLRDELILRGYDITTLRFSIQLLAEDPAARALTDPLASEA